jgi:hypothetical protein
MLPLGSRQLDRLHSCLDGKYPDLGTRGSPTSQFHNLFALPVPIPVADGANRLARGVGGSEMTLPRREQRLEVVYQSGICDAHVSSFSASKPRQLDALGALC